MKAFDKWLAENEKVWIESRGALDNNPDEYYRLINDEI